MFNNSSKILFFLILLMGTLITISSNSWLGAWMGLEINLLAFIPMMNNSLNSMSTESSLKYFLTQAMASAILLFCIIILMMKFNFSFQMNNSILLNIMLVSTLLLKSGAAPFHFWFPEVMEGLTWMNAILLMTWQKIAPLILISYIYMKNFLLMFIITSTIIGSIGGFNQTSVKKIMAFSSINHLGWMLTAMMASTSLWMSYFLFYSFLISSLILLFYLFQINHINQLFSMYINTKNIKFMMFINFLSLGGLPPFLGFLPKWLVINFLIMKNQLFLMMLMVMFALITLFFYLRMCYTSFMLNFNKPNWNYMMIKNNKLTKIYMIFSFISTFGLLLITPIIFNYMM